MSDKHLVECVLGRCEIRDRKLREKRRLYRDSGDVGGVAQADAELSPIMGFIAAINAIKACRER